VDVIYLWLLQVVGLGLLCNVMSLLTAKHPDVVVFSLWLCLIEHSLLVLLCYDVICSCPGM
jgi:hypothetical protein